jgi:hypothetical protein
MDPIWHHLAWLLAFAQRTRTDRTLSVLGWKMLGFGVSVAVLLGGAAHMFGWHARDLITDSSAARNDYPSIPARAEANEAACHARLNEAGVSFRALAKDQAPGVAWPIELTSDLNGVFIQGGKKNAPTNFLDCRLALALLVWIPSLREQGIVSLQHMSMYRRDALIAASNKQSGHALGLAIDVGRFELHDGRELSVLEDWVNRERGADPCREWPSDEAAARIMRKLVCDAYAQGLFQSIVTPHENDAHNNHVHLEIRRENQGVWMD